jgi:hypothetical protein
MYEGNHQRSLHLGGRAKERQTGYIRKTTASEVAICTTEVK